MPALLAFGQPRLQLPDTLVEFRTRRHFPCLLQLLQRLGPVFPGHRDASQGHAGFTGKFREQPRAREAVLSCHQLTIVPATPTRNSTW